MKMMMKGNESFLPTLGLGVVFVILGSCRYLLIKFSANEDGKYDYLPVTVNVCAEITKLIVCSALSLQVILSDGRSFKETFCLGYADWLQLMKWSVPGFLYFCDNLLAFYIIRYLQPAVVVLLGNFVIITTSLLFRLILRRVITRVQWASLLILFLAILSLSNQSHSSLDHHKHHAVNHLIPMDITPSNHSLSKRETSEDLCHPAEAYFQFVKNATSNTDSEVINAKWDVSEASPFLHLHEGHILILIQCLLSSSANIYNEKIFKEGDGMKESIYIQNSKLYLFGVVFNTLTLLVHGIYRHKIISCGFFHGHNLYSIALIFVTACYGLTVALILKFRDNMFHLMSSQLITLVVICASIYFFDFSPNLNFILAAPIVLLSIYIFNVSKYKPAVSPVSIQYQQGYRTVRNNSSASDDQDHFISPDNLQE